MNTTTLNQILVFTTFLLLLISVNVRAQTIGDAIRGDIEIQKDNKQEQQNLARSRDWHNLQFLRNIYHASD